MSSLLRSDTRARRVTTASDRASALTVLDATYAAEKQWVPDVETMFPVDDVTDDDVTWIVATVDGDPAGVLRVHYAPPLHLYAEYGLEALDGAAGDGAPAEDGSAVGDTFADDLDVDAFIRENDIAEIGRFAVLPQYRRRIRVVFWLMRVAFADTLSRDYTHYVTDVFEGDEHSPYNFHTRVLGFTPVASHETGELDCIHRRITLILNLKSAYHRLKSTRNRLYRFLTDGWDDTRHRQLALEPDASLPF